MMFMTTGMTGNPESQEDPTKPRVQIVDKRDFLFRFVSPAIRYNILVDEEAMYSTTDQVTSRKICDEISRFTGNQATIVDATACVGGLTYTMAGIFHKVIAIELDPTRFEYLQENMKLLQVSDKVECLHGDALELCKQLEAAVIVLDPPWGGPEYKNSPLVNLTLNDINISDVCIHMFKNNKAISFVAIKVPTNFDDVTFKNCIEREGYALVQKAKLRKMYLLIVKRLL
jgi:tRNA G37 N-methylase Trm5